MQIQIRGDQFEMLPEKVLHWPARQLLVVADLHLGKAEIFQQRGLWLPSQVAQEDLDGLLRLAHFHGAKEILFLGDLVHAASIAPEITDAFAQWSHAVKARVTVILGNHDRGLKERWPREWEHIESFDRLEYGNHVFEHDLPKAGIQDELFHWVGHLHPVYNLSDGTDRLRLPCFAISKSHGILPAYSGLAGGYKILLNDYDQIYISTGQKVLQISNSRSQNEGTDLANPSPES